MNQFDPIHDQVLVLAKGNAGPPTLPPGGAAPTIQVVSKEPDDNIPFHALILDKKRAMYIK
tara:strand:+ start:283 stop:465 length:183 start_codon:yes stop_codon:yes gene_type:complete